MSRILNEKGQYDPAPLASSGPIVAPVSASKLPQQSSDPYENVNAADFSTAHKMSRAELVTMGEIAAQRGLAGAAMQWKSLATEHVRQSESDAATKQMTDSWKVENRQVPPHGSEIVEASEQTPWGQDEKFQKIAAKVDKLTAVAGWENDGQVRMKVGNLQADLADRKAEVIVEATADGYWGEMQEGVHDAERSLAAKSDQLVEMMKGGGS